MSVLKLIPAWTHGIADYTVGFVLISVAVVAGGSAAAIATGVVVGVVIVGLSALTRYPFGLVKLIPFAAHSAGDYSAAASLIAAPWVLGYAETDAGLMSFYVVLGAAIVAVSLLTNYQDSPTRAEVAAPTRPVTAR